MRINDSRLFGITNSVLHNSSCHVGSFNNQLSSSRFKCSYSFQTSPAEQLLRNCIPTGLICTGRYRDINRIRPNILEMSAHFRRKCLLGGWICSE
ncbi:hypothetical protein PILCRDRAFT_381192 [Piloderma croceum F 1598]|uniref:Uncharacterized protein n=1 Tax=Piloderma croceum (strain F 1598) TaxID=765440 RepID=A0A0C3BFR3_PILCF|nr:hypothetical protein PILCRDRAFT_381192 [Piloderma croceum F 1598]